MWLPSKPSGARVVLPPASGPWSPDSRPQTSLGTGFGTGRGVDRIGSKRVIDDMSHGLTSFTTCPRARYSHKPLNRSITGRKTKFSTQCPVADFGACVWCMTPAAKHNHLHRCPVFARSQPPGCRRHPGQTPWTGRTLTRVLPQFDELR